MKKAYTLLEIVLAIGLTVVMSGSAIAAYVKYNRSQMVNSAYQEIMNVFREARTNAMTGKMDCNQCDCDGSGAHPAFNGWMVYIDCSKKHTNGNNNVGYEIEGECQGPPGSPPMFGYRSKYFSKIDIRINDFGPVNLAQCNANNNNNVRYLSGGTGVSFATGTSLVIKLRSQFDNSIIKTINVDSSGVVH